MLPSSPRPSAPPLPLYANQQPQSINEILTRLAEGKYVQSAAEVHAGQAAALLLLLLLLLLLAACCCCLLLAAAAAAAATVYCFHAA